MLKNFGAAKEVKKLLSGALISAVLGVHPAYSQAMTAGVVMEKMNGEQLHAYLAGIVEGLAYARYAKDGKQTEGMRCIYEWFYQTEGTQRKINQAFERFSDYTPGAVVAAMTEKECGS